MLLTITDVAGVRAAHGASRSSIAWRDQHALKQDDIIQRDARAVCQLATNLIAIQSGELYVLRGA